MSGITAADVATYVLSTIPPVRAHHPSCPVRQRVPGPCPCPTPAAPVRGATTMTETPSAAPTRDLTALAVTDALTARAAASRLAHRATAVGAAAGPVADALTAANGRDYRVNGRHPHEYAHLTREDARTALALSMMAWSIGDDAVMAQDAGDHALATVLADETAHHAGEAQRHAQIALDTFQLLADAVSALTRPDPTDDPTDDTVAPRTDG